MHPPAEELPKAPLIAHFAEFRRRVMIAFAAFAAAFVLCYCVSDAIYAFLVRPLAEAFADPSHKRLIYTSLAEAFFTYIKLSLFGAFFVAFPVIASQLYLFLSPGLYKKERRLVLPYLVAAPVLFLLGASLAYHFIIPAAWHFFIGFETPAQAGGLPIQLEAKVNEYLSLTMQIIMAFGLSFQLPVALTLMAQFGMVQAQTLMRGRRYALVIIVIVAAFITPPDVLSQIGLSIPLYLLYELSIISCRMVQKPPVGDAEPTASE